MLFSNPWVIETGSNALWTANLSAIVRRAAPKKKADVGEHPEVFPHVGLLFIEPPRPIKRAGLLSFQSSDSSLRVAKPAENDSSSLCLSVCHDLIKQVQNSKEHFTIRPSSTEFRTRPEFDFTALERNFSVTDHTPGAW